MNYVQIKNFITHIKTRMKVDPKYHLLASDMHASFSVDNMTSVYVIPYLDQDHYDKNNTVIKNGNLAKHLIHLMKMSGNDHLIEDIKNTL